MLVLAASQLALLGAGVGDAKAMRGAGAGVSHGLPVCLRATIYVHVGTVGV